MQQVTSNSSSSYADGTLFTRPPFWVGGAGARDYMRLRSYIFAASKIFARSWLESARSRALKLLSTAVAAKVDGYALANWALPFNRHTPPIEE